jgi:hypothetical protein
MNGRKWFILDKETIQFGNCGITGGGRLRKIKIILYEHFTNTRSN